MENENRNPAWEQAGKTIAENLSICLRNGFKNPAPTKRDPWLPPYPEMDFSAQRKLAPLDGKALEALGRAYDSFPKDSTPFNETYYNQTFFRRLMEVHGGELIRLARVGLLAEQDRDSRQ